MREGETVLLHAAGGGVGLLALQILKRRLHGARVIGVVGSPEKCDLTRDQGCDHATKRRTQDYVTEIEAITAQAERLRLEGVVRAQEALQAGRTAGKVVFRVE